MNDRKTALKIIAFMAIIGLALSLLAGCQKTTTSGSKKGPKVLFFTSDT